MTGKTTKQADQAAQPNHEYQTRPLCEECGAPLNADGDATHFDDCTIGHGARAMPKGPRR